jgi:hypothetical protein
MSQGGLWKKEIAVLGAITDEGSPFAKDAKDGAPHFVG